MTHVVAALPTREETRSSEGIRAVLYDADGSDREIEASDVSLEDLKEHQLLWVDVEVDGDDGARKLQDAFGLEPEDLERAMASADRPRLDAFPGAGKRPGHRPTRCGPRSSPF